MNNSYHSDRQWSDAFIPEIKRVIGPFLLATSSFEQDTQQASDLVVLKANSITIACRIRKPGFLPTYQNQFTIRYERPTGAKTEFEKIVEGWGDWMFYAHATTINPIDGFALWHLIDLSSWRAHLIRFKSNSQHIAFGFKSNPDGTKFAWFNIPSFSGSPPLLIASSPQEPDCPF